MKHRTLMAIAVAIFIAVGLASPASAATVSRYQGSDRIATADAVSGQFAPNVPAVVLVSSASYADAVSCGAYAGRFRAPILLSTPDRLSAVTESAIRRLAPNTSTWIFLCGGSAALSPAVEQRVRDMGYANVARHAGADRYETSVKVAEESRGNQRVIVLASGHNYTDALIGSYIAGKDDGVLLLTDGDRMPAAVADFINRNLSTRRIAVGVAAGNADPNASEKLAGNRYTLSAAVAGRWCGQCSSITVVSGRNWPDALAAVPLAIKQGGSVLFTRSDDLLPVTRTYLRDRRFIGGLQVQLVGGSAAISTRVETQIVEALS